MRRCRVALLAVVLLAGAAAPVRAQGYPVFDVVAIAKVIAQLEEWKTYIDTFTEYKDRMEAELEAMHNLGSYAGVYEGQWQYEVTKDSYGRVKPFVDALNDGHDGPVRSGYNGAIRKLLEPGSSEAVAADVDDYEDAMVLARIGDTAAIDAVKSVGIFRRESKQLDEKLRNLDQELSGPDDQKEKQVFQKLLAGMVVLNEQMRQSNRFESDSLAADTALLMYQRSGVASNLNRAVKAPAEVAQATEFMSGMAPVLYTDRR